VGRFTRTTEHRKTPLTSWSGASNARPTSIAPAKEKIRIALASLRGEESVAALCRREGIAERLYYFRSKEFLAAGKTRLAGDTARQATAPKVKEPRSEALAPKEVVAALTLENRLQKKA
jgi:transposase